MISIVLAALLSQDAGVAVDAGEPVAITLPVDYLCQPADEPWRDDAGTPYPWHMSDAREARIDCIITGAQVELNVFRAAKVETVDLLDGKTSITLAVLGLLTALVGAYGAWQLAHVSK